MVTYRSIQTNDDYNLTDIYTREQSNKSRESHHCSILI